MRKHKEKPFSPIRYVLVASLLLNAALLFSRPIFLPPWLDPVIRFAPPLLVMMVLMVRWVRRARSTAIRVQMVAAFVALTLGYLLALLIFSNLLWLGKCYSATLPDGRIAHYCSDFEDMVHSTNDAFSRVDWACTAFEADSGALFPAVTRQGHCVQCYGMEYVSDVAFFESWELSADYCYP